MADVAKLAAWCGTFATEIDAFGETKEGKRLREVQAVLTEMVKRVERPSEEALWIVHQLLSFMRTQCKCALISTAEINRECSRCKNLREGKKHFGAEYIRAANINAQMGPK